MKPEPLDRKEGYVDSWQIRDKKDVHPSHRTKVFEAKDIKSACDFYWRYKDNLDQLTKEYPEYTEDALQYKNPSLTEEKIEEIKSKSEYWGCFITEYNLDGYNEWLFKLAFKDVFKEAEQK